MDKKTGVVVGVIVLIVLAGGVYAAMNTKKDNMVLKTNDEQKMMDDKIVEQETMMDKKADTAAMKKDSDTVMKKDESNMADKDETMMKVGSYEAYSANKIARAETGDVVLFFYASWCPSCRGLDSDIVSNVKSIPGNLSILKLDYDKETELKKKYGVTSQHTLVQVDKDGNMIKKWSGGSTLSNLVSQI